MPTATRALRAVTTLSFGVFLSTIATHAQNAAVTIGVDAAVNRHPIDANVYGVAHATAAELSDLNVPLVTTGN
jgi:hypothetical protein